MQIQVNTDNNITGREDVVRLSIPVSTGL